MSTAGIDIKSTFAGLDRGFYSADGIICLA
jgi:hypothetical protein